MSLEALVQAGFLTCLYNYVPGRDPVTIERSNLLNVCKLVVKELIDSSLKHGRMIDGEHVPLQQFFVVLEHVFRHGLKREHLILSYLILCL